MIRVSNIDEGAHTADFHCDGYDAFKTGVNVDTELKFGHVNVRAEAVGTGDGSQTVFQLDAVKEVNVGSEEIYVDGNLKTGGGTDYTLTALGVLTFVVAPGNGLDVTANYGHDYNTKEIVVPGSLLNAGADQGTPPVLAIATTYPTANGGELSNSLGAAKSL